jgi:pimeloyl-ACP methyl ester carboxylesterase
MTVLFVHGMPMTSSLWRPVIDLLDREDLVALDLPGFRDPPPEGWVGTKEDYVGWLIDQIEAEYARTGPVHLVGHDWGCLLALRAASLRPELLRSVAAGNGPIDPGWPLHGVWQVWNQEGTGEQWMEDLDPEGFTTMMIAGGMPEDVARDHSWNHSWNRDITLTLYRSASNIGIEWADDLTNIVVPSMLIWGERDLVVPVEFGRRMATRMGAEVVTLDAQHFWPAERPAEAAAALTRLWDRAESMPNTILTQTAPTFREA